MISITKLSAARIAIGYAVISTLWVAFSDVLFENAALSPKLMTLKGVGFVWITAFLLYITVKHLAGTIRDTSQNLSETTRLYQTVVQTSGEGVCLLDPEGNITFANSRLSNMLGYPANAIKGKPLHSFMSAGDNPSLQNPQGVATSDCCFQTASGQTRWTLVSATPLSTNGTYCGSLVMILDITERKHLEEQLRHSQKLDALGRFAGGIAHDFNNLLAIAIGHSSLLEKKMPEGSPDRAAIREVLSACERGAVLVRHLLAFSRKQLPTTETIAISKAVAQFSQILPRILGEDVAITINTDQSAEEIRIGAGQLEQIVMNLACNARDAMPAGGSLVISSKTVLVGKAQAETEGVMPGMYASVSVSDTGTGIAPEIKSRIFEPFFTTKPQQSGTGLGLSIVYGITHQNSGFITCESEAGRGTTFSVFFPLIPATTREVTPFTPEPTSLTGTETILLVEDEPGLRSLTSSILHSHGYRVLEAANGSEALQLLRSIPVNIDLLLTDVVMPGMGGPALAQEFARLRPDTRIAFMSGYAELPLELRQGAHFIEKPVTPDSLMSHLRSILDSRHTSSELRQ